MDSPVEPYKKPAAVDPEMQPALDAFVQSLPDPDAPLTLEQVHGIRAMFANLPRPSDEELSRDGTFVVTRENAPGLNGAPDVPLLVFRPHGPSTPPRSLVWIHGGGMIFGDYRDGLDELLDDAAALGAALVAVNYRLAPETPHPGPLEDCYAALLWAQQHASPDGSSAVVAVGASAGGGLAAGAALMSLERGDVHLAGQMLLSPMLDHRNDSASMRNLPHPTIWSRRSNGFGWNALLGEGSASPLASPALATLDQLTGLAPTFISVGGADGFRDEDSEFALRASRAGVLVEFHLWPGGYHGFEGMAPDAAVSRAARAARSAWLTRILST